MASLMSKTMSRLDKRYALQNFSKKACIGISTTYGTALCGAERWLITSFSLFSGC